MYFNHNVYIIHNTGYYDVQQSMLMVLIYMEIMKIDHRKNCSLCQYLQHELLAHHIISTLLVC